MSYRGEVVQVAAVAAAMVQDHDTGATGDYTDVATTLDDVRNERYRQFEKWGNQTHHPAEWLAILMEEVGEAADEVRLTLDLDPRLADLVRTIRGVGQEAREILESYVAIHEAAKGVPVIPIGPHYRPGTDEQ